MTNREKIPQLIAFICAFSLLNPEYRVGLQDSYFGVNAQLVLLKISRVDDCKAKDSRPVILASLLNLLSHLDAPLLILNLSLAKELRLSAQELIERDIAIYEKLHRRL